VLLFKNDFLNYGIIVIKNYNVITESLLEKSNDNGVTSNAFSSLTILINIHKQCEKYNFRYVRESFTCFIRSLLVMR